MAEDQTPSKPSISSVDARVGRLEEAQSRLEARQLEQDGVMRLIQLEQTHIREIMTSRFVSLEQQLQGTSAKLDNFMGKMEALVEKSNQNAGDLNATALGRLVDGRLRVLEDANKEYRDFRANVNGMTSVLRVTLGGSLLGLVVGVIALARAFGVGA